MLTTSLPSFQMEIFDILKTSAADAFMKTVESSGNNTINSQFDGMMKKTAEKFGLEFANKASSDLANAIMKYIQTASLSIVVQPQALATIISPVGPCTGALAINDGTATINIL